MQLAAKLSKVKIVTYMNACRGKEYEPLAYIENWNIDSLSSSPDSQDKDLSQKYLEENSDGPREDLYQQIFTKIRQDENTFIHFSTIKGNVRFVISPYPISNRQISH